MAETTSAPISAEIAYVEKISGVIEIISDYVEKYLSEPRKLQWFPVNGQITNRIDKLFHKCFLPIRFIIDNDLDAILPLSAFLILPTERLFIIFFVQILRTPLSSFLSRDFLLFGSSLLIVFLVALYITIGAYWTLFELIGNRDTSRYIKIFLVVIIFLTSITIIGIIRIPSWLWDIIDDPNNSIHAIWNSIEHKHFYSIIADSVFYTSFIIYMWLWLTKLTLVLSIKGLSIIEWFFKFNLTRSEKFMGDLLSEPLPLISNGELQTMLELDAGDIDYIHGWVTSRRQTAQGQFEFMSIILVILGIWADTYLKDATRVIWSWLRSIFTIQNAVDLFLSACKSLLLIFVIIIIQAIILMLGKLFNKFFVMDHIAEACVVAKHAKLSTQSKNAKHYSPHCNFRHLSLFRRLFEKR